LLWFWPQMLADYPQQNPLTERAIALADAGALPIPFVAR
jgi:hypothetical protein